MRALAANSTTQTMRALAAPEILDPSVVFGKLFELMLGKARQASEVTAGHQDVADATAAALQDAATQQRYAPRRPNMLPRVLSASNDESFSRRDLAALIARDPSLVGNLLKIANSSFYRVTPEPVESVDRAVVLLGTDWHPVTRHSSVDAADIPHRGCRLSALSRSRVGTHLPRGERIRAV